jgi:hypothetical protein
VAGFLITRWVARNPPLFGFGQDKFQVRKLEPQGKISCKNNFGEFGRLYHIIPSWIEVWIEKAEEPRSVRINFNNNPSLPCIVLTSNSPLNESKRKEKNREKISRPITLAS